MTEKKMNVLSKYKDLLEIQLKELKGSVQKYLESGSTNQDVNLMLREILEIERFLEKYNNEIGVFIAAEENVCGLINGDNKEQYEMFEKLESDAQNILYGGYVSDRPIDSKGMIDKCISRLKRLIVLLDQLLECEKIRINNLTIGEIVIAIDIIEKSVDKLAKEPSVIKLFEVRKDIISVARKLTVALNDVKWNKDIDEYDNIIDNLWSAEDKIWVTIQMLGSCELNRDLTDLLYGANHSREILEKYLLLFGYAKCDALDEVLSYAINKPFIDIDVNNIEVLYNSKNLDCVDEALDLSLKRVK